MQDSAWLYLIGPLAGLGALVVGLSVVPATISRLGWSALAAAHGAADRPQGVSYIVRSARFGGFFAAYNNAVRVVFTPRGAHLSMVLPFMLGHRPFMLPWAALVREGREPAWFGERYVVEFDDPAGRVVLRLPVAAQAALRAARGPGPAAA